MQCLLTVTRGRRRWGRMPVSFFHNMTGENENYNDEYEEAILLAAENGDVDRLRVLIAENGSLVNIRDTDGYSPLHRACYSDKPEAVKGPIALSSSALVLRIPGSSSGSGKSCFASCLNRMKFVVCTPYMYCLIGLFSLIQLLLENGASVNGATVDGWTPLHSASRWNAFRCLSLLLMQPGIDVNAHSKSGQTPLHIASSTRNGRESIHLLLNHSSIFPDVQNSVGETPQELAERLGPWAHLFELIHPSLNSI
ncbi:unnamed protein product [Darwinula stevensoni]|uniref:Uncharacterized protein n=1 Tax=Darwinula stevensoni TaxID=69355 RepID=A0A7R9FPQ6_9CRUS|nr:unnamed protein product [Darwinula stevensoni]CAG0898343.1 unnamed protein product [Darwinula stevensoni]